MFRRFSCRVLSSCTWQKDAYPRVTHSFFSSFLQTECLKISINSAFFSFPRSWRTFPLLRGIILCTPSTGVAVWGVNSRSQLVVMRAVWCQSSTQHWPWKRRTTCIQRAHSWTAACSQWHPQTWRYCIAFMFKLTCTCLSQMVAFFFFFSFVTVNILWKSRSGSGPKAFPTVTKRDAVDEGHRS